MQDIVTQLRDQVSGFVPNLLAALAILVVGWLASLAIAGLVRAGVRRSSLSAALSRAVGADEAAARARVETWIGRVVFYLLMVFVVMAAFQALQLTTVTAPLEGMLQELGRYVPQLVGAALLLLAAWLVGAALRLVVTRGLSRTAIDERMAAASGVEMARPLSQTLGEVVFWVPLLLFLPAVIGVLGLQGLTGPLQGMLDELLAALPNLLSAALILLIGWFIARIVRQIVTALLAAAGLDGLGTRVGMGPDAGPRRLSAVVGLLVYALIIVPVAIAALEALRIEAISRPATLMLNNLLAAVPLIFGAALVLGVAFLLGRVLAGLVTGVLTGVGFDTLFEKLGLKTPAPPERGTPSQIAGYLTLVAVMLVAAIEASDLLGFVGLSELVTQFFIFGTKLLFGLVIFGIGLWLGNLAYRAIPRGGGRWPGLYAGAARVAIVTLATAMALQQTGVAQEIVTLAFGLVLGTIAVAAALAFGLGAREPAARLVKDWVEGGQRPGA